MNERIHMIVEGTVAEQVAKLEPTIYRKYIWHDKKGKPMLYVRLKNILAIIIRHISELGLHN